MQVLIGTIFRLHIFIYSFLILHLLEHLRSHHQDSKSEKEILRFIIILYFHRVSAQLIMNPIMK